MPTNPNFYFVSYYMMWNVCHQSKHVRDILFKAHMMLRKRCDYTLTATGKQSILDFWRMMREPTQELFNAHRESGTSFAKSNCGLLIWLGSDNDVLGVCEIVDFSINRLCVKEDGKGLGTAFYKGMMAYWLETFRTPLYIRASKRVVGFFRQMGCLTLDEGEKLDKRVAKWASTRTDGKKKDVGMYDPVVVPLLDECEYTSSNQVNLNDKMMESYEKWMLQTPNDLWNRLDPKPVSEPEPKKPAGLEEMLKTLMGVLSDTYGVRDGEVKIESVNWRPASTAE
jgi:hypothetical protein